LGVFWDLAFGVWSFLAMKPSFGESNMGALAGAIVGAVGGLFGVGTASAIIGRNPALLFDTPVLGLICFFVSGSIGWVLGGQIGPRLGDKFQNARAEIIGGLFGGLLPATGIALWGWYMITPH
jgi:hypothetical protein